MTTTKLGCRKFLNDAELMSIARCGDYDADTSPEKGDLPFLCRGCFYAALPHHSERCAYGFGGDCTCGAYTWEVA